VVVGALAFGGILVLAIVAVSSYMNGSEGARPLIKQLPTGTPTAEPHALGSGASDGHMVELRGSVLANDV
jgi:hypothetical protein